MNEKQGTLSAYGARFLLIPVKLIHSIEDRLTESFGPVTATSFQYEIGREGGAQYIHLAQKAGFSLKSPNDIQKIASSLGTLDGWGKLQIVDFDPTKKFARIRWKNGVSVRNRKGKTPVCHFGAESSPELWERFSEADVNRLKYPARERVTASVKP